MAFQIRESDWKLFRDIRVTTLDRFCQRVLAEVCRIASITGKNNHERYLAVFKLIREQDEELADMFDTPHRSTALLQLARMQSRKVLTEEEFARFSSGTRDSVQGLLAMWRI
jgi:hypothetical protein